MSILTNHMAMLSVLSNHEFHHLTEIACILGYVSFAHSDHYILMYHMYVL